MGTKTAPKQPKVTKNAPKGLSEIANGTAAHYILLTCSQQDKDGLLDIKFSYSGDPTVLMYLLSEAQRKIEGELQED